MTNTAATSSDLKDEIQRQLGSQTMSRFLNSIPHLGSVPENDSRFQGLLAQLERAEKHGAIESRAR